MSVAHDIPDDAEGMHTLVDQMTPQQRRAVAPLLRLIISPGEDANAAAPTPEREGETESGSDDYPKRRVPRELSWVGMLHGPPDLASRAKEILREELADKHA